VSQIIIDTAILVGLLVMLFAALLGTIWCVALIYGWFFDGDER
jgi:hypothetical protein